ncbi:MAG: dTDP-4-dehydrorhamnose 3,5-epimerase family protein, partial [Proteobacteria bacterium]|nr:dTDP-4-dehydrorhamnose 3,5-epimerase family protein [Pseudomonadota bacterium]
ELRRFYHYVEARAASVGKYNFSFTVCAEHETFAKLAVVAHFDVAVDMRRSSPNFGRWVGVELTAENQRQLWIPPGFAHGFVVISETADFLYKTSGRYAPECEGAVRWDDPTIGVAWPLDGITPQLSAKDVAAPLLADAKTFD